MAYPPYNDSNILHFLYSLQLAASIFGLRLTHISQHTHFIFASKSNGYANNGSLFVLFLYIGIDT